MKKVVKIILIALLFAFNACSVNYNFTGSGKINAKTFQVNYFQNNAAIVEPGIERIFTRKLQTIIQNQTNLNLIAANADLVYEGEIVDYRISPAAATSVQTQGSALNRMEVFVNVRFSNKNKEDDNFEKRFTFFYDYPADKLPASVLNDALEVIYSRITQDIFNESLAKW